MSCGPVGHGTVMELKPGWWNVLSTEGFRLFFPLSAIYVVLWPLLWVLMFDFDLPMAREVPPQLWHAHEMLVGAFGAALIGFLTTAAPEWTDTPPLHGRKLWGLAGLWATGRIVGLFGWDSLGPIGAFADFSWQVLLLCYLFQLSWRQRTDRLIAFIGWLAILLGCVSATQMGFLTGDIVLATKSIHLAGFAYLGLLGLALGRITVPVTNLILDPSEKTSPFRPHPGRLNLAPGLVLVAIAGDIFGLSPAVSGFLLIAAGAAFMDRIAEAFIGRAVFRSEILMLAGASAFAGIGLVLTGCYRLGAPWAETTGLHAAFLGGLGLGVYAVFCIAGKLHTGNALGQSLTVRLGAVALVFSMFARITPDFGFELPGPFHGIAVSLWSLAFLAWIIDFWPSLSRLGNQAVLPTVSPTNKDREPASEASHEPDSRSLRTVRSK
ncbi:NnrS family protein [Roseibium sp. SCP14]|uniref:NnrS family protein n=1 Tax=Roseibium sp. SCP14 TaxID=3141375 RepID=UPI003337BA03